MTSRKSSITAGNVIDDVAHVIGHVRTAVVDVAHVIGHVGNGDR